MSMRRSGRVREDDTLSYCGSISGETFSSRRSKTACSLRQHSIDVLAQKLKEFPFPDDNNIKINGSISGPNGETKRRFNESFHHYRLVISMLGGLSFGLMILLRFNISIAILNMVNQTALYMEEHPDSDVDEFLLQGYQLGGDFDWDNEIQNMIMSWYMIAYTLPQVASTKLGLILGARLATPISLSICALANLLTPISAYWGGWQWVIVVRLLNGIGASAILPMMLNLIENWTPHDEITLGLTMANILQTIISSTCPVFSGYLCSIHWSYAFYVPGIVSLLFCVIWLILVTDRPDENWLVSQKELVLICGCSHKENPNHHHQQQHDLNDQHQAKNCKTSDAVAITSDVQKTTTSIIVDKSETKSEEQKKPNLIDIFKVPSFYIYMICHALHCSSFNGFMFVLPNYLRQFLKIDISENGLYCSIIQSGSILAVMWPHPLLYILQTKLKLSLTTSRRITYAIGCVAVASIWTYVGSFHHYQLLLLFIGRCFHGCNDVVVTGSLMGNFASTGLGSMIFSMVNTVGNFSVVFVSTLVGWYLDYSGQSREGWFWILSILGSAQLVIMILFATCIRSEPIEFNGKGKGKNIQPEAALAVKTTEQRNECSHY